MELNNYFDRCIDLTFFDYKGFAIGSLATPKDGYKPDIKVEGSILMNGEQINTKITISNFSDFVEVNSVSYINAALYYGGMTKTAQQFARTKNLYAARAASNLTDSVFMRLFTVDFADYSKQPPDKQITFNCIQTSNSSSILGNAKQRNFTSMTATQEEQLTPVSIFLSELIKEYNKEAMELGTVGTGVTLAATPKGSDSSATEFISSGEIDTSDFNKGELTLSQIFNMFYDYNFNDKRYFLRVQDNSLWVVSAAINDEEVKAVENKFNITHIVTATRKGPIIKVNTLFDPRLTAFKPFTIRSAGILARGFGSVGGRMAIALPEVTTVIPTAKIDYAFGTVSGNSMTIEGHVEGA